MGFGIPAVGGKIGGDGIELMVKGVNLLVKGIDSLGVGGGW